MKSKFSQLLSNKKIVGLIIVLLIVCVEIFAAFKGFEKIRESNLKIVNDKVISLRINEYVVRNKSTFRDENWESPDWIEIYNYGQESVWLGNVYLSDDIEDPQKFLLPDIYLKSEECLLVLASGGEDADDGYIRASFKLGEDDEGILLFCDDRTIDYCEIVYLPVDISAGYAKNGNFGYFSEPTPGSQNTTQIFSTYDIEPKNHYEGLLFINEYVPDNTYGLTNCEGQNCDWIELYNPNDSPVFLGDIFISDNENELDKFRLPDMELAGKEYIVLYASGENDSKGSEICVPFRISTDDKKLILTHITGNIIDEAEVYDLNEDVSAGLNNEGDVVFFAEPTPGSINSSQQYLSPNISAFYKPMAEVVINEWMSNNEFGILDEDGDLSDWVELYNPGNGEISLKGYALTDDDGEPFKWLFPDTAIIPANDYLIIYLSGKDKSAGDILHSNFSLSEGETFYLTEPNTAVADYVKIEALPGNVSKGRTDSGYGYFALPTPGKENTTGYVSHLNTNLDFVLGDVYISEVASGSYQSERYKSKPLYEYVELYNGGEQAVDLSGYCICENSGSTFVFGEGTAIKPKGYLLVALKGYTGKNSETIVASELSLDSSGERLLLSNASGVIVDCFDTGYLLGSYSSGRIPGSEENRVFFKEKTPGAKNSESVYTAYSIKPEFSRDGGEACEKFNLCISAEEGAVIYYTLDGNVPTENSKVYTQPVLIEKDIVVRAMAVVAGKLPSLIETNTYILERTHDIPVICLSSPPGGMFYELGGIYAGGEGYGKGEYPYFESNYFNNVERQVSFEYYDEYKREALEFDAGIQIAGGFTRALAQKSLVIRLRDEYGLSEVDYPFFDEGTTLFKHLLLRNDGQEGWKTKIIDCFIQNCAKELGTVDAKRGRPVAVYINGEYWGLYNLRDKLNDEYLSIKYGIDQEGISILTEYSSPKKGSNEDWLELKSFCQTHDMSLEENYIYLASKVDVQAFMDYMIVETFFGNVDTHNINFWKAGYEGAKWKPFLFDMDLSIRDVDYSMVNMYLGRSYLGYDSFVIKSLAKYEKFQQAFIKRYSYILSEVFTEEYLLTELELLESEIQNEITYQIDRWNRPKSFEYWQDSFLYLKNGVIKRRYDVVEELQEYFGLSVEEIGELFPWYVE